MKRIGALVCLMIMMVTVLAPASFAANETDSQKTGFAIVQSVPHDKDEGVSVENLSVKIYFNKDVMPANEEAKKANDKQFKLTDKDGNNVPIKVYYSDKEEGLLMVVSNVHSKEARKAKAQLIVNSFNNERDWHFYVDGSYSHQIGNASYGIKIHQPKGVLFDGGIIRDSVYSMSSQGAEFYACMRALELAFVNKCESVLIYYDNEETGRVVRGQKDEMSKSEQLLLSVVEMSKLSMDIQFIKIKGHSFVESHNQADKVANSVRTTYGEFNPTIEVGAKKSFFVNSKNIKNFQHNKRILTI